MELNKLFKKQLIKTGQITENINDTDEMIDLDDKKRKLLEIINDTYKEFEEDRDFLERSIDISSKEYMERLVQIKNLQTSLISNEKMASIGQLSAGVAHEINNPLSFIQSNLETFEKYTKTIIEYKEICEKLRKVDYIKDDRYINAMKEIENQARLRKVNYIFEDMPVLMQETIDGIYRIVNIVNSLLDFSRMGLSGQCEDYDINKGIKDTLTISYNQLKYHAKLEEEYGVVEHVKAKGGEINQVILNIIMNAAYATKGIDRQAVIKVKTYSDEEFVYCEITDNGVGMDKEQINHIFEPFYTTKPIGSGTGLGLSISYDIIVNKHGGKIEVFSKKDKGSTFKISLKKNNLADCCK